ncbi:unnamed protein product [Spirodela intermedia]|uniref:Uncharacterized protein n=1 Tax=Spirodela intermedia TaxID=51605 RepID=A0A7I8INH8_SPIIN|nr:unnamed protein product [Spirodela intermedia]CAA6659527.1 unnamed protein product [Spirodela intermedia]
MSSLYRGTEALSPGGSSRDAHCGMSVAASPPQQQPHFVVNYLMKSCGFPQNDAVRVSGPGYHENPAGGVCFLGQYGLKDYHGRHVGLVGDSSAHCVALDSSETMIKVPKEEGPSGSDIMQLFSGKLPDAHESGVRPKVEFLGALFGSKDRLLKASHKNRHLMMSNIDEKIKPNVSLLRECLTSDHRVMRFVSRRPRLITSNSRELGHLQGSGMFEKALCAVSDISRTTFDSKFMLMKSFGWSEAEFLLAFRKNPTFLGSSEMKIRSIMEFLLKEVGCMPSYVASHPILLTYSLEGRLKPRQYVLRLLKLNDIIGGKDDFLNAVSMTEKAFLKRYVIRNTEKVPDLLEGYVATCARGKSNSGY